MRKRVKNYEVEKERDEQEEGERRVKQMKCERGYEKVLKKRKDENGKKGFHFFFLQTYRKKDR